MRGRRGKERWNEGMWRGGSIVGGKEVRGKKGRNLGKTGGIERKWRGEKKGSKGGRKGCVR